MTTNTGFGAGFEKLDPRILFFLKGSARQNFGDYLSALLIKHLFSEPRVEADIFRLIGSVICETRIKEDLRQMLGIESGRIVYWGCGAREDRAIPPSVLANCRFHGVRGPLTRDLLGLPLETVLGDPGLLTPLIVNPSATASSAGKTICMPHMHDPRDRKELLAQSGCDMLVSPSVGASERELVALIETIASAEFVLTGSLHGAILAAAYRKPFAYWNTGFIDIEFKWHDFSASAGFEAIFVRDLAEGRALYAEKTGRKIRLPRLSSLLAVAPFAPKVSAVMAALRYDGFIVPNSTDGEIDVALRNFDAEAEWMAQQWDRGEGSGLWSSLSTKMLRRAGALREKVKAPAKRLLHV
ncbi:hypothetical protein FHS83_003153 [Rhizomicrobium palustre]|uniref:Polysaccharide pyruvyl transferase domain-containing protein n=1 Tax=Rhizomicrobium palustre TaxID=189966 RepID=A0A846N2X7_9PROT|nr:polysaccharide pyruvyl transferase family protein [Rhizomicrobium palustre]NIK89835.1 hypothetical protein [Rhizomicrobium palustre]